MTNEIQIFENEQFGQIRTIDKDGKVLFCAKDVAISLGYKDHTNAIKQHCKGVVKRHLIDDLGRKQLANFIPEGDIYRLAARSELPGADAFESWIFDEVLPSIRKHGQYTVDTERHENWEIAERNSRSREAALWLKIGETVGTETYKHICASYASKALAGNEVIPLPKSAQRHYTASEIGNMFGVSAHKIGVIAKANHLKTEVYGSWYHDKSPFSAKEVETFRYNNNAVERFREIFGS